MRVPSSTPATKAALAEDRFEYVAEIGKAARATAIEATTAILGIGVGRMAITVVSGALLRVFQTFIGFGDRLELGLAVGAPASAIRMIFHRELAIGALYRVPISCALDFEQFVIIHFGTH